MPGRILLTVFAAFAAGAAISCHDCVESDLRPVEIQMDILDASIIADLMPVIPPDPVSCNVTLLVKNTSPYSSVSGFWLYRGTLRRTSGTEPIDTFYFSTSWDGYLAPLEADTVRLTKFSGETPNGALPCGEFVSLSLTVRQGISYAQTVVADSILFQCVY